MSTRPTTPRATLEVGYIEEPLLEFAFGQQLAYPRDGLFLYGPVGDSSRLRVVHYGVIGPTEGIRRFRRWSDQICGFIPIPEHSSRSRNVEAQNVAFPGFAEAFRAVWPRDTADVISDIDESELLTVLKRRNRHEAVRAAVGVYVDRLIAYHNRSEDPPTLWFVVIPEFVFQLGRPRSTVPVREQTGGEIKISLAKARHLATEPTLFGEDERDAQVYQYANHFRRQLKARLLKDRIVTQVIRETTLTPDEFQTEKGYPQRRVEDPATIAWKLGTAAYYKAGGRPWQLANVREGVCYVGLVYKRSDLTADRRYACCAAQMFLSDGDGVVFRGALGPWYQTETRQFHLDRAEATRLVETVVAEFKVQAGAAPKELFIHAKAAFTDDEWEGFTAGCPSETNLVGVQIVDEKGDVKLYRPGSYPVIRGTTLRMGSRTAFLWTSGYVPRLDTYPGPDTPNPILVKVLRGDCALDVVLRDILGLTKINFNTCLHNDRLPVTLRFASDVGDVLIAAPNDGEPRLPFKFYI